MVSSEQTHGGTKMELQNQKRILRLKDVMEKTGLSRSTIYLKIKHGDFPKPIDLGPRCIGWLESEIIQWIENKIKQSRR